ncbi:hypothetical protein EGR_04265 [Echinococcus granulosus]|uniref:Uncharacterized protein n=1 Tax=Echinococcus granulosus TaxID=6210 RepID=W6UIA2_ECHGR|nr:hypothetical protein EGR_04265 [Echinococcus granulosus]EUB60826.1 hypothetical protein EGR_04265 [Echinococcus granulosus]
MGAKNGIFNVSIADILSEIRGNEQSWKGSVGYDALVGICQSDGTQGLLPYNRMVKFDKSFTDRQTPITTEIHLSIYLTILSIHHLSDTNQHNSFYPQLPSFPLSRLPASSSSSSSSSSSISHSFMHSWSIHLCLFRNLSERSPSKAFFFKNEETGGKRNIRECGS